MKFIGKEQQKKIEVQTQYLIQKVSNLEAMLLSSKTECKQLEAALVNVKAENEKLRHDAKRDLTDIKAALQAKAHDLDVAQAALVKAKHDGEVALSAFKNEAASRDHASAKSQEASKAQLDAAHKALANAKAQLDTKTAELEAQNQALAGKAAELEAALSALKHEAANHDHASATAQEASRVQLDAAHKALAEAKAQLDNKTTELAAKSKDLEAKNNELHQAQSQLSAAQTAASQANQKAAQAQQSAAKAQQSADVSAKDLSALKAEREKQAKLAQQTEAKYQDSAQENELLLLQLMQAQEELVEYYEQKGDFEKLYLAYKARWERLEKRLPNYLDFGAIEIANVDGVSDVPSITWQVKDFAQSGVALSEFSFVTLLQDGHPGIGLVKDGQHHAFVPKLLGTNKDHLATFLGLGTTDFKQLTAAVSILDQLEALQWKGFESPAQFDLNFWRPSIQTLIAQLKQLPALLRYDEVRLKRELINPDYEHLWLEFRGLSLGALQWKKFEIRLGAALVQNDGFSQYPKFEIPLIDGKTKPFESWYAESQDDSGAKLELRFALEKNVFDVAVWAKLADADKALVLRIIYAMPEALKRLEKQKVGIHRPWVTWIDFATSAVKVLEVNKAVSKLPTPAPAQTKVLPAPAAQAKLPVPTKLTSIGAKAKVISITSKPVTKSVAKPKSKPVTAKAATKAVAKTPRKTKV